MGERSQKSGSNTAATKIRVCLRSNPKVTNLDEGIKPQLVKVLLTFWKASAKHLEGVKTPTDQGYTPLVISYCIKPPYSHHSHLVINMLHISSSVFLVFAVLIVALNIDLSLADDGWKQSRATWFDIHDGDLKRHNCHFDWNDIWTGDYVGAFPDGQAEFSGSCGKCYAIRCNPDGAFNDGNGKWIDRKGACKCNGQTIVITIADACPCDYPANQYSNQRWCCSDGVNNHMDISRSAFEALSDLGLGVIGIEYKEVDCASKDSHQTSCGNSQGSQSWEGQDSGSGSQSWEDQDSGSGSQSWEGQDSGSRDGGGSSFPRLTSQVDSITDVAPDGAFASIEIWKANGRTPVSFTHQAKIRGIA
eukprot:gene16887-23162_t